MLADIRITDHIRRGRLCRHLRQAALGAQVGLGASTISAYEHGDAQALRVTVNDLATWTDAPTPPGDTPSASTDGLRAPSSPGPRCRSCSPRQNSLYLSAEFTRPCLCAASFTSNHATERQDEASTKGKPTYAICGVTMSQYGRLHPRPEVNCQGARTLFRIHWPNSGSGVNLAAPRR